MTHNNNQLHFIAIGGSLMHNLAMALAENGYTITGSDDEIYEPSRSKLQGAGLLPEAEGWFPEKVHEGLSAVILGMHARSDNPELKRAQELNIPVYSFPEFIYEQSKNKQRIVITGSHGKSTITSMIMHILAFHNRSFDYAVGAEVPGFPTTVRLSNAPIIVIEGDEYLSSAIDREPKFLKYQHHITLISGISWDHINVFPTEAEYINQFEKLADLTPKAGSLAYCEEDPVAKKIGEVDRDDVTRLPYGTPSYEVKDGKTILIHPGGRVELRIFGKHNLQNLMGAKEVLSRVGISEEMFYEAIGSFEGASRRLEMLAENGNSIIFRDYAHAPSKVRATINAVKEQYPGRKIRACLELHTFSSLTSSFLPHYKGTMDGADEAMVYFNPKTLEHKRLPVLEPSAITKSFDTEGLRVFTDQTELLDALDNGTSDQIILLMSSGTFDNMDMHSVANLIS
ncbi:UDP-N-acetylmuramate--L-alanine ligase [Fulvivirga sedimenti]|uniref:Mur ligase domain-containing protein n=1 Tax=Fulvivirga sedimenti TaxID=2879465 RepID=A0A9X1KUD1_9BACT|nr:Mur ligase family protein [Fulvivirga sedimenti]MCA6073368.1 Mur ligase domain-containing protein [Fulvivirga sedimenti]